MVAQGCARQLGISGASSGLQAATWQPWPGPPSKLALRTGAIHRGLVGWWMTLPLTGVGGGPTMLRREFALPSVPRQASIFISGIGFFQLFINGKRVDTGVLSGAWTTWNERVIYFT